MPVHDWPRVDAGIFHAFHLKWIAELDKVLNSGLLPPGYYALPEQHAGSSIPDILTLHARDASAASFPMPPDTGGTAVAEAPPQVHRKVTVASSALRRRTLAIRHVSHHRLVAILEIVSPANKDRSRTVMEFVEKIASALEHGIHALVVDLHPPGVHDLRGMHGAVWEQLNDTEPYDLPAGAPRTLASYVGDDPIEIYLEHPELGAVLPAMPLFFTPDRYVLVPMESTYLEAYRTMPSFWRNVLEGPK